MLNFLIYEYIVDFAHHPRPATAISQVTPTLLLIQYRQQHYDIIIKTSFNMNAGQNV